MQRVEYLFTVTNNWYLIRLNYRKVIHSCAQCAQATMKIRCVVWKSSGTMSLQDEERQNYTRWVNRETEPSYSSPLLLHSRYHLTHSFESRNCTFAFISSLRISSSSTTRFYQKRLVTWDAVQSKQFRWKWERMRHKRWKGIIPTFFALTTTRIFIKEVGAFLL